MIKLIIRKTHWSDDEWRQASYERGQSDQAKEDADVIRTWLVENGQIKSWLAPEIEVVESLVDEA